MLNIFFLLSSSRADIFQDHPWVTKGGTDPLLPVEENCSDMVDLPTEEEKNHAITGNMNQLIVVVCQKHTIPSTVLTSNAQMKAVKRFKKLLFRRRPELMDGIFGRSSRIVAPPGSIQTSSRRARSSDADDRKPVETALATEGIHHDIVVDDDLACSPAEMDTSSHEQSLSAAQTPGGSHDHDKPKDSHMQDAIQALSEERKKGHAHDPLQDTLYLNIGTGDTPPEDNDENGPPTHIVCESPGAIDSNLFEAAYQEEMHRILDRRGRTPTIYLTRRVEHNREIREHESVIRESSGAASRWAGLAQKVKGSSSGSASPAGERKEES